jgi:hypothetical protein
VTSDRDLEKIRIRLTALELMFADMYAKTLIYGGGNLEMMRAAFQRTREQLKTETFPTAEPVQSDHYAAELEEAVAGLQALIEDLVSKM